MTARRVEHDTRAAVAGGAASTRRTAAAVAGLLALTLIVYAPALRAGFIWDDDDYIENNAAVRNPGGWRDIWLSPGATPQYYPLVFSTFWLEHRIWGLNPTGYHVVNVLLHATVAVLAWRLLRRLRVPGAWFAAALFAVHPVHVESVAWVTERKNVLCGVFYLAAMLAYFAWRPATTPAPGPRHAGGAVARSWRAGYGVMLMCFAAAMLSKTIACSLPAALLVIVWWQRGRLSCRRDVWPLLPCFALGAVLAAVTVWVERGHVGASGAEFARSAAQRALLAGQLLWFYAWKLLWPRELLFFYPRWMIDAASVVQWAAPLAAGGLLLGLPVLSRRIGRGPAAAVLLYAGTLLPALGLFNIYWMRFSYAADHFVYLSSLPLLAALAAGGAQCADALRTRGSRHLDAPHLAQRRRRADAHRGTARPSLLAFVPAAVALALLGVRAHRQTHIYESRETLWRFVRANNPGVAIAHANLGVEHHRRGEFAAAFPLYQQALALDPTDLAAVSNLALVARQLGRLPEAVSAYEAAAQAAPDSAQLRFQLGLVHAWLEQFREAEQHYRHALRLDPTLVAVRNNLGTLLLRQGRPGDAIVELLAALDAEPGLAEARKQLVTAYLAADRPADAAATLATMVRSAKVRAAPEALGLQLRLADALQRARRPAEAIAAYHEILARRPQSVEALTFLAWLRATHPDDAIRDGREALELAERAVALSQERAVRPLDALAAARAETGQFALAVATARRAAALAATQNNPRLIEMIEAHLREYEAGRPVRAAGP